MAKIVALPGTEEHAVIAKELCPDEVAADGPAGRSISRDMPLPPRTPERAQHGRQDAEQAAARRNRARFGKHFRRVGLIRVPPLVKPPRVVDGQLARPNQGLTEGGLVAEFCGTAHAVAIQVAAIMIDRQ